MDIGELLAGLAQLALGLVGFAGLAAIFVQPRDGKWPIAARLRLRMLIEQGFFVMFASLLPMPLLLVLEDTSRLAWQIASLTLAPCVLFLSQYQAWRVNKSGVDGGMIGSKAVSVLFKVLSLFMVAGLIASALLLPAPVQAAIYFAFGILGLVFPSYNFIVIVVKEGAMATAAAKPVTKDGHAP